MRSRKGSFPERVFERALWATRYIMVVAVVAIVVLAVVSFYYALVDLTYLLSLAADYASLAPSERPAARGEGVTTVVKVLDGFFIGALLLVVAASLYELFVGRIEGAETSEVGPRLLRISSLEDLKQRVAKLVGLILVIELFQRGCGSPTTARWRSSTWPRPSRWSAGAST